MADGKSSAGLRRVTSQAQPLHPKRSGGLNASLKANDRASQGTTVQSSSNDSQSQNTSTISASSADGIGSTSKLQASKGTSSGGTSSGGLVLEEKKATGSGTTGSFSNLRQQLKKEDSSSASMREKYLNMRTRRQSSQVVRNTSSVSLKGGRLTGLHSKSNASSGPPGETPEFSDFESTIKKLHQKMEIKTQKHDALHLDFVVRDDKKVDKNFFSSRREDWGTGIQEEGDEGDEDGPGTTSHKRKVWSVFSPGASVIALLMVLASFWTQVVAVYHSGMLGSEIPIIVGAVDILVDAVYFISALAHLRISFIKKPEQEEIFEVKLIQERLFKKPAFYADLISCIPFHNPCVSGLDQVTGSVAFIMKLPRMRQLCVLPPAFSDLAFTPAFMLFRMVFFVLLGSHNVACIWFMVIMSEGSYNAHMSKTFASDKYGFSQPANYCWVFRDAAMMMIARDRSAFTDWELLVVSLASPVGSLVTAAIFGNINWIYHRMNHKQMKQFEDLSFVRSASNSLDIPLELKDRILAYFRYTQIHLDLENHKRLFQNLSPPLLMELKLYLYAELLSSCEFFSGVPNVVVKALVTKLTLAVYSSGDFIVLKHEAATKMFFILRGSCEVVMDLDQSPVCSFSKGQYFGEMALYTTVQNARRTAWVRAASYCQLAQLERAQFEDILSEFPEHRTALATQIGEVIEQKDKGLKSTKALNESTFQVSNDREKPKNLNESKPDQAPREKNEYVPSPPPELVSNTLSEPGTDPVPLEKEPPGENTVEAIVNQGILADLAHHFHDDEESHSSKSASDDHCEKRKEQRDHVSDPPSPKFDNVTSVGAEAGDLELAAKFDSVTSVGAEAGDLQLSTLAGQRNPVDKKTPANGNDAYDSEKKRRSSVRSNAEQDSIRNSVRSTRRRSSIGEVLKTFSTARRSSAVAELGPESPLAQAVEKILPSDSDEGTWVVRAPVNSREPVQAGARPGQIDTVPVSRKAPHGGELLKRVSQALMARAKAGSESTASSHVLEAVAVSISTLASVASFEDPASEALPMPIRHSLPGSSSHLAL